MLLHSTHVNAGDVCVLLQTTDIGESMYVHVFGAYFGLSVARVLYSEEAEDNDKEGSVYHSDIFSMIGELRCPSPWW